MKVLNFLIFKISYSIFKMVLNTIYIYKRNFQNIVPFSVLKTMVADLKRISEVLIEMKYNIYRIIHNINLEEYIIQAVVDPLFAQYYSKQAM